MKKSLLALIACLVMAVAPAWAGWNIVGSAFNNWSTSVKDCVAMTETSSGVWTVTTEISGEFKFLYGNSWKDENNVDAPDFGTSEKSYNDFITKTITKNGGFGLAEKGGNFKIETSGTYTFTLNTNTKQLTVSGFPRENEKFGIHGTFTSSSSWETKDLVQESEDSDEYTLTAQVPDGFTFGIKVMDLNGSQKDWKGYGSVTLAGSVTPIENSGDFKIASGGNYKFTYNPDTNTLNIDEIITYGYAIKVGNSYYALTDDNNSGTYNVVANGRQGESFQLGKYVTTCAEISDSFTDIDNFTLHSNILTEGATTLPKTASYTFAFNPLSETLTINEQGDYKYAYVLKNGTNYMELQEYFYGNWEAYYQEVPANYSFQIIPYYPGTDYKVEANCAPAVDATFVGDVLSKSGTNYTITSAGTYSFSYHPQKNEIDVHVAEARWWIGYDEGPGWQFGIPMEQQEGNGNEWKAFVNFTGATVDMPYFAIWYGIQPTASTAWKDTETEGLTRYYIKIGNNQDYKITDDTEELELTSEGSYGVIQIKQGEWTVIVKDGQTTPTITFDLGNSMGVANMWIIRDGVTSARSMTPQENNKYSVSEPMTQGDEIYFQVGSDYYYYDREATSTNIDTNGSNSLITYTYKLIKAESEEDAVKNAVLFSYAKDIKFELDNDPEDMTLKAFVPTEGVTFAFNDNTVSVMQDMGNGIYKWSGNISEAAPMRINIFGKRYTFDSNMVSVSDETNTDGKYEWIYTLMPYDMNGDDNRATIKAVGDCDIIVNTNNLTMTIADNIKPTDDDLKAMIIIANTVNSGSESYSLKRISSGNYTWSGYVQSTQMVAFSYHGTNYDVVIPDETPAAVDGNITYTDVEIVPNTESASEAKQFGYTGNCDFNIDFNNNKVTIVVPAPVSVSALIITPASYDNSNKVIAYGEPTVYEMTKNTETGVFSTSEPVSVKNTDHIKFRLDDVYYTFDPTAGKTSVAPLRKANTFSNTHNYDLVLMEDGTEPGTRIGVDADCNFSIDPTTRDLYLENDIETMVAGIATESGETIYFNLQGQRIERPAEGICIRVTAGKAEKVMIK